MGAVGQWTLMGLLPLGHGVSIGAGDAAMGGGNPRTTLGWRRRRRRKGSAGHANAGALLGKDFLAGGPATVDGNNNPLLLLNSREKTAGHGATPYHFTAAAPSLRWGTPRPRSYSRFWGDGP